MQAYSDVAFDAVQVGLNAFAWESPADVNGCVRCHGAPYRKHGNIQADVTGAPVFAQCKTCHFDNRVGGHEEWQYMVDDPENWATGGRTDADIEAAYAYTAYVTRHGAPVSDDDGQLRHLSHRSQAGRRSG